MTLSVMMNFSMSMARQVLKLFNKKPVIVKVASARDSVELEQEIQKKLDAAANAGYTFDSSQFAALNVAEYVGSENQITNYTCVMFFNDAGDEN